MQIISSDNIPKALREIPEPPKQLYVRGTLPSEDLIYLTVVGTRKFTSYGKRVCERLIGALAGKPVVIVSGLALGIDTIAHETALKHNIKTIAFPGSGLDDKVLYPRTNWNLAMRIIESGGCLLSEYEPQFRTTLWSLPKRNRLMAGISKATLLIEAGERSGTLITARLAVDYNRDVLVVPGNIDSEMSKGVHQFLKLGATPITSEEDLLDYFGWNTIKNENTLLATLPLLNPLEKKIFEILSEPRGKDEVISIAQAPVTDVFMALSELEIKGLIVEEYGNIRRVA